MKRISINIVLVFGALLTFAACVKEFLPEDRLTLGADSRFTQTLFQPVLGRNNLMENNFYVGSSSQPLDFKIVNIRRKSGEPAPELTEKFPVKVWKAPYDGTEQSLEEIEAKRATEYHAPFEVREHSGDFVLWSVANSAFVHALPDSGYVFDVEVSNSGGRRYFRDLLLKPYRERPYEPSNLDPVTGLAKRDYVFPTRVRNLRGEVSNGFIIPRVMFYRVGDGNSLTFRFLDTLMNPIDPNKFELTKWDQLVHGFNMEKTNEYVRYDVAYPIPLITYPTAYTTDDGSKAHVEFMFSRIQSGNINLNSSIEFDFNIYRPGDWEIVFWFADENPKFEDD